MLTYSCKVQRNNFPSPFTDTAVLIVSSYLGMHSWSPTFLKHAKHCEQHAIPVARAALGWRETAGEDLIAVNNDIQAVNSVMLQSLL